MTDSCKYYFDDLPAGRVLDLGSRGIGRDEIVAFAREYDPQPFHVDEQKAARSLYGGLIASGWQTCGIAMRLLCDNFALEAASLGSPGVDHIRWLKPVRPGDQLHLKATVVEANISRSKPQQGSVRMHWEMSNQHGEVVMTMDGIGMYRRRPAGASE
jgi:acyl dehydratase